MMSRITLNLKKSAHKAGHVGMRGLPIITSRISRNKGDIGISLTSLQGGETSGNTHTTNTPSRSYYSAMTSQAVRVARL